MKVWIYAKRINRGYEYIHVFQGKQKRNNVLITKSLIRYGDQLGEWFTAVGSYINISLSSKEESYENVKHGIVRWIFDGSIELGERRSFDTEVLQ